MKKLLLAIAVLTILALPYSSFAAIAGSDHDMTAYTGGDTTFTKSVCMSCHVPHNAVGSAVLWSADNSGAPGALGTVASLCWTCHNGDVTTIGSSLWAAGTRNHTIIGSECSGAAGSCHDVHTQNPVTTGKFLTINADGTYGSNCVDCHDATPATGYTGHDKTDGIGVTNHYIESGTLVCEDCHGVHSGVAQTDPANDSYILLMDNGSTAANTWGQVCIACHNNQSPYAGFVSDVYNYENVNWAVNTRHTTHGKQTGATYSDMSGCNECHHVHAGASLNSNFKYLLNVANINSDLCQSCHLSTGSDAPDIGGGSHPVDTTHSMGTITNLPWANAIDDDGTAGADWTAGDGANDWIVCESCHSAHRLGVDDPFLRVANGTGNTICRSCHTTN